LSKQENIQKEVTQLQQAAGKSAAIEQKLDELVSLLSESDIDSLRVKQLRSRVNQALDDAGSYRDSIDAFKQIDSTAASGADLLDEFSVLLASHPIDSKTSKKYLRGERLSRFFMLSIALVLITLGFAMIIMPASHDFEMYTIFNFNPDDGVTIMDLISLLIVLTGVFLLVKAIYKKNNDK